MIKGIKKGFTLVELLVVIAILAILATVSIVGYTSFIDKAHESNDIALAKEINTLLLAQEVGNKIESANDAVKALNEAGFYIGNLNPSKDGNYYVWDKGTNQIIYVKGEDLSILYSSETPGPVSGWWLPISTVEKLEEVKEKFSNFLFTEDVILDTDLSFEKPIGLGVLTGKTFATTSFFISIETELDGEIILDGTFNGKIIINAPNCDFVQCGTMTELVIERIDGNSAHINGFINELTHIEGRLVIEEKGYIMNLIEQAVNAISKIEINGIVQTLKEASNATYIINGGHILTKGSNVTTLPETLDESQIGTNDDYSWDISSVEDLIRLREAVNSGYSFAGTIIELTNNIDLSNINWNIPIGSAVTYTPNSDTLSFADGNPFSGIFNGNGYTIKGLTMYDIPEGGYGGGLFGYCQNATIYNFNLVDVNIDTEMCCSPVAAHLFYYCYVGDINITGICKSNWSAGIASYASYGVIIENCNIDMDFEMSNYGKYNYIRLGGVIGQYNYDWYGLGLEILNSDVSKCTFTLVGSDKACKSFIGAYVAQHTGGSVLVDYKTDNTTIQYTHTKTSGGGDIDPTLLGISLNLINPNNNMTIQKYNLTVLPSNEQ